MNQRTIRVFVSSPGDVGEERAIARRVIARLKDRFAVFLEIESVLWEWEPILGTGSPQSQIVRPSQTDIVVSILWTRLGTPLPESFRRPDGTLYGSGTEFELEDAAASWKERGVPSLLVYRRVSEPFVSLSDEARLQERLNQRRALEAFVDRWCRDGKGAFQAFFHEISDPSDFEEKLEQHLLKLLQEKLPTHLADSPPSRIVWTRGSPFRGLEPFEAEHRDVYFGRTRAVSQAKEALQQQLASGVGFLLIQGASGSGKSSLLRAGLVPRLLEGGVLEDVQVWRAAIFRPSGAGPGQPILGLAEVLATALPELACVFRRIPDGLPIETGQGSDPCRTVFRLKADKVPIGSGRN